MISDILTCNAQDGAWDDVSGETFLRKLLTMPIQEAKYNVVRASPGCMYADVQRPYQITPRHCTRYKAATESAGA